MKLGQVVAEHKRSDLEGFLGQHFPASDIPQQARALYLRNTIRVISDASGARSSIMPERDASGEPLDLSYAHLRSVSPIHCEYLRNMGVAASMSISIITEGKLWGMIACHHYAPRTLPMCQRVAAELFGEYLSLQLEAMIHRARLETTSRARRALRSNDARRFLSRGNRGHAEGKDPGLLLVHAVRRARPLARPYVEQRRRNAARGRHPRARAISAARGERRVWATNALSANHPPAARYADEASGVLAIPLSQRASDCLLFFRREVIKTIDWAGDPNKQYAAGPLGDRLTPRKSFAIWKETVEHQSQPWTGDDREIAEATRTALLEIIMRHTEIVESERQTAAVRQRLLNEELNHRVKNILALIKSLVSQPVDEGRDLVDYVNR